MNRTKVLLLLFVLLSQVAIADVSSNNPLEKLDWLVGEWSFVDIEINGDYEETGTRTCSYVMNDSYIFCESRGRTASGPERFYRWYFNYNDREQRFEGSGSFSNYPRKQLYELEISDDGLVVNVSYMSWEADGVISDGGARITYNGKDQYVWDGMNGEPDPETGEPTVSFRDTVTRIDLKE